MKLMMDCLALIIEHRERIVSSYYGLVNTAFADVSFLLPDYAAPTRFDLLSASKNGKVELHGGHYVQALSQLL